MRRVVLPVVIICVLLAPVAFAGHNSEAWDDISVDETTDYEGTSIAVNSTGAVFISYQDAALDDLVLATYHNQEWSFEVVDSDGSVGEYSALVIDSWDGIHIAYYDATNTNLKYANYYMGNWTIEVVDSSDNVGTDIDIALDSNNLPHISYRGEKPDGNGTLKYIPRGPLGWPTPITQDQSGDTGYDTSIAIDSDDDVHISYYSESGSWLKWYGQVNGQWSTTLIDNSGDVGSGGDLAISSENILYFVYYDADNSNLKVAFANESGENIVVETVDRDGNVGEESSITLDDNDSMHIAYLDSENIELKYATYSDETWYTHTVDGGPMNGNSNSITMYDSADFLISYLANDYSELKLATQGSIGMLDGNSGSGGTGGETGGNQSGGNQTGGETGGNQTGGSTGGDGGSQNGGEDDQSSTMTEDEWYEELPYIGEWIKKMQTKYGRYISMGVVGLTILAYAYRAVTLRSEFKQNSRVKKLKKEIKAANSAKALRKIQLKIERMQEKRLLPDGALGDLLSMIELRAEDLGLSDFIKTKDVVDMGLDAGEFHSALEEMRAMKDEMASQLSAATDEIGALSEQIAQNAPSQSLQPTQAAAVASSSRPMQKTKSMRDRMVPDINKDGHIDDIDREIWENMSPAEKDAFHRQEMSSGKGLVSEIVAFSKIPVSPKHKCKCGSGKPFGKCCMKKISCPCGSNNRFIKCCAHQRGFV